MNTNTNITLHFCYAISKDPGVQFYGGSLFRSIRDFADDQFNDLAAPVPKPRPVPQYQYNNPNQQVPLTPVVSAPINMASFNSRDQPCFHGDHSLLLLLLLLLLVIIIITMSFIFMF